MATQAPTGLRQWDMHDISELAALFPGADFASVGPDGFHGEASRRVLDRVTIEGIAATPYLVRRREPDIAAVPSSHLYLHVVLEGHGQVERGADHVEVTPYDVFFLRPDRPFGFECPVWTRTFRVTVPETLLPVGLPAHYEPPLAILHASTVTRAFLQLAQDLIRVGSLTQMTRESETHLESALIALEHGAVAEALAQWPPMFDSKTGLRAAVLDYIETNFREPGISPTTIAREFQVSLRTIHNVFVGLPETAAQHIRRRRIDEASVLLRTRDITSTQLAADLGFTTRDTFIRAFQQQQGVSPAEYRALRRDLIAQGRSPSGQLH